MPAALKLEGQKFHRLLVLKKTDERKNGSVVWQCQCDCGKICTATTKELRSGNKKSCGCLNNEKRIERIKHYNKQNEYLLPGMEFNELTLLEKTSYKSGTNNIWKCQCSCGKICYISTNNLKIQKSCGHLQKQLLKNNKNIVGQKFGKLTALEPTFERKNNNVVWKCQCECGNICYKRATDLIRGQVQSCGCLKSKGEEKIIKLLEKNNILFKTQYSFNTCVYNQHLLFFDFFVNGQYCIEYDGIQHFQQTGWENLSIIQARDDVKNQWCQEHHMPLIRIPYTHLEKLSIEDLKLDTTTFLVAL